MAGVLKLAPLPNGVPLDATSYQSIVVPPGVVADIVSVPVPHRCPFIGLVGGAGTALTVAVTAVLVVEIHPVVVFLT